MGQWPTELPHLVAAGEQGRRDTGEVAVRPGRAGTGGWAVPVGEGKAVPEGEAAQVPPLRQYSQHWSSSHLSPV